MSVPRPGVRNTLTVNDAMLVIKEPRHDATERFEMFERYARRRAAGEVVMPLELLPKGQRLLHIRQTLREDHQFRIHNRPEGAQAKFDKLSKSPFKFFRGTALLYYRDQAGMDSDLPTVLAIGDVHPENFGVMPNENGAPFFGLDDFDEAHFAPFSWDVKRGAVGFYLIAKENGIKKTHCRNVVRKFVDGYLDGLLEFACDDREKWHQYRIDNSPPMIRELLEQAMDKRKQFLAEMVDIDLGRFRPAGEIVPYTNHVDDFQDVIDHYREECDVSVKGRRAHFNVKDVAVKKGSGTASLGLDRYFVLIEGAADDHSDDIILEMKQARRSALQGLAPVKRFRASNEAAERVVNAHYIHLVGGDSYYGKSMIEDQEFTVRERSPYKDDIDVDDLDKSELANYAAICGKVLAQAHARSDEDTEIMEGCAEKRILRSINRNLFLGDVVRFSETTARRVQKDYKLFCKDHAAGAFRFVHEASSVVTK